MKNRLGHFSLNFGLLLNFPIDGGIKENFLWVAGSEFSSKTVLLACKTFRSLRFCTREETKGVFRVNFCFLVKKCP